MIKFYNTLSRKKEIFEPSEGNVVRMYSCGPTVYSYAHIGNLRAYIFMDTLRRVLKYNGYNINGVMNITDVGHLTSDGDTGEDKMEKEAEIKRKEIETQLSGSKYGVAYIDATDRVIQLNRPLNNNLLESVDSLTSKLYNELRMPLSIFDGTATEEQQALYYKSTVVPIATAIVSEMSRKFLTQTARTRNQAITFINDPLKYITIEKLGDLADKLIRNEIVSANEVRVKIGFRPNGDPKSDELKNPNMPQQEDDGLVGESNASGGSPPGLAEFIETL